MALVRSTLLVLLMFTASCSSGRTVMKKPDITLSNITSQVVKKKRGVIVRYYVRPGVMFEQSGTLRISDKENYVVFQYYNNDDKEFIELDLPVQNISEISYENQLDYDTRMRIIGITTLLVTGLVVMGIYI